MIVGHVGLDLHRLHTRLDHLNRVERAQAAASLKKKKSPNRVRQHSSAPPVGLSTA